MTKPIPEWCRQAAIDETRTGENEAAAIIAEEHEKGCNWNTCLEPRAVKIDQLKQVVRELVEAARQAREVAAAAFRIAERLGHWDELESEMKKAGVEYGFGKRLQAAITKVEELR